MELRKGYKQTGIGVIPEDWEIDSIKHHCSITTGDKNTQDRIENGMYPFFVRSQTVERINSYTFDGEAVLTAGDGVGTGKIYHYINGKFDFHQRVYKMSHFSNKLDGYFFYLYFSNNFYSRISQMTAKSSVDSVRMEMIADMSIPLPPTKAEQTAIARALSDADAWIQSLTRLIAKKRQIKQGAMQTLLNPFKNGCLKAGWVVKKLGEVAFVTKLAGFEYTKYFNSYKDSGEIIVIRGTNITKNELDLADVKTIPSSTSNKLLRSKLNKGDLVFAYVGTIGPVYLVKDDNRFHLGPNTCKISAEKLISREFLYIYFTSNFIENEIVKQTSIGAQPSLSMTKIRSFKISFPEAVTEQIRIATILSDLDNEIVALEAKLTKAQQIEQGMMQNLLTGRIRLI